jgi:beta-lactamase regulating signal transducer with metallopeptidase domain
MSAAPFEALASGWLGFMVERGVAGLLALPLVAVAWVIARRRGSPHLTSALLLIALAPLVIPSERLVPADWIPRPLASLFAPVRFGDEALPRRSAAATTAARRETRSDATPAADPAGDEDHAAARSGIDSADAPASTRHGANGSPLASALFAGWLAIVAALLVRLAIDSRRTRAALARARPLDRDELRLSRVELARRAGLFRLPPIVASGELPAPSTCGPLAPVVVLPPDLRAAVDDEGLRFVLLHELAHVRRRDPLLALLERLIRIVWFAHPTAWLAGSLLARERERACDDAALSTLPVSTRPACAQALFRVVERASVPAPVRGAALALTSGGRAVKERLLRIVDPAARAAARLSPCGRVVAGLFAAALLVVLAARVEPPAAAAASAPVAVRGDADPLLAAERSGIEWLLRHQEEDGRFSAVHFDARCRDANCNGAGSANADVGVTALAAEALLGSPDDETARAAAERALDWLVTQQDRISGLIAPHGKPHTHQIYGHAFATLALVDGAGDEANARFKEPAQRAIHWLLEARNPYRGWRYGVRDGDNDSSLTGLVVVVLKGAKGVGFQVDDEAVKGGITFLDEMTDEKTGRTGYQQKGGFPARTIESSSRFPAQSSESLTAVAMNARIAAGQRLLDSPPLAKALALVHAQPPRWDESAGTIDYYYWYFATRALFLLGGADWRVWKAAVVRELTAHQCTQRDGAGSFPPADAWSGEGGRVYATAINLLTLEICSRGR